MNGSAPSLQGDNVTDGLRSRGVQNATNTLKKLYDLNGAIGGPDQAGQAVVLLHVALLHERVLHGRPVLSGRTGSPRSRVDPTSTPGLRRHLDGRQQQPPDVGADAQAEDLRLVCVPAQGRSALAPQILFMSPEAAQLVTWPTQLARSSGRTRPRTRCCSKWASRRREPGHDRPAAGEHGRHPDFELGGTNAAGVSYRQVFAYRVGMVQRTSTTTCRRSPIRLDELRHR